MDFKNSTSKSSSLIRNFINQVNNPAGHAHTKSIQALKGGKVDVGGSLGKNLKTSSALGHSSLGGVHIATLENSNAGRGLSNRNRHVNPYIQSKNRQSSMIGGISVGAGIPEPSGTSRNQGSSHNSTFARDRIRDDTSLERMHQALPARVPDSIFGDDGHAAPRGESANQKGQISARVDRAKGAASAEKKSGGVHTLSQSLKQKIEHKSSMAQKQATHVSTAGNRAAGQQRSGAKLEFASKSPLDPALHTLPNNDKGSQERPPHTLATDRSDQGNTQRRKKNERQAAEVRSEVKGSLAEAVAYNQKPLLKGGSTKKARPQPAKGSQGKYMQVGRGTHPEPASKQAVNSPLKGSAPSFGNKYNNQYVGDALNQRKADGSSVALAGGTADTFALKGPAADTRAVAHRMDTSVAVLDTNEINEVYEGEASADQLFE